jgi:hypothetical protein
MMILQSWVSTAAQSWSGRRRPVLTANQVAFWAALRLSGTRASVIGYGRIFDHEPLHAERV